MTELEARIRDLRTSRRNKKSLMTRNVNMLMSTLADPESDRQSVVELMQKSEDAFGEVESVHQSLCASLDDDAFEAEEEWIQKCQESFWKARNSGRKFLTKKGVNKDNVSSSNINACTSSNNDGMVNQFSDLRLALELPKAHISEFNGDPVNYWSFINNFNVNVASKLSNDNARLQYLLQLCKGKARACIESCALLESGGYEIAMNVMRKQFGQPHMILDGLITEMLNRKRISNGDGEGLWNLVSAMKKCEVTLSQMGYLNDLNSTSTLLKIQSLLPIRMQNAWADKAHDLLEKGEPKFVDMIKFIERKAEVSCNMFGRSVGKFATDNGKERPRVKTNNIQTKRKLSCFYCEEEHMLTACTKFLQMSYDDRVKVARDKRLCYKCLIVGHSANKCRREDSKCGKCDSTRHHNLLHPPNKKPEHVVTSR